MLPRDWASKKLKLYEMKNTLKTIVVGFIAGLAGAFTVIHFYEPEPTGEITESILPLENKIQDTHNTNYPTSYSADPEIVDFSYAASKTIPSVVYINSISKGVSQYTVFDLMFGGSGGSQTQVSSGSGVIFSADGYIVTNNHVVESAERLEVVLNKKVYKAELIGTDPSTDLAVLKIDEKNLPAIAIGNSTELKVGEWVVAVGNPFSLSSTVTTGIVSAKGRRIGILEDKFPIESFIQTDAAINPGNSGGALVNKKGELIGINTAILSRTGSYTGYAFAIPVDIAKKVVSDLVKYGVVQKALYGGNVVEYDYQNAKKYNLDTDIKNFNGVLLESILKDGPANNANLKPGDVITKINETPINSKSEFEEVIGYRYPGDKINITYTRNKKTATTQLTLTNRNGGTDIIKREIIKSSALGAELEATEYGVKVFKIQENSVLKQIGITENFTIIAINRERVKDPKEVEKFFDNYRGRGYIYGINSIKQQREIPFTIR